jgi:acetyltransferase-like isoleucine patch superfamily enzyme
MTDSLKSRALEWAERRRAPQLVKGQNVSISRHARVYTAEGHRVAIGSDTRIEHGAIINPYHGQVVIGERSFIGPYCLVYGHGGLSIGDDVLIATHTVIVPSNHTYADPLVPINQQGTVDIGITIESNVWIGAHATILDGVTISSGAVVAAGAVVNRDVATGEVVGGIPARVLKCRDGVG